MRFNCLKAKAKLSCKLYSQMLNKIIDGHLAADGSLKIEIQASMKEKLKEDVSR